MPPQSSTQADGQQQQSELELLRQRLFRIQPDIQDEQLWQEISAWLYGTADSGHTGSLESHVRGELADLTREDQHKMYPHADVDKPEDAFPDRCRGCEHYGIGCPILADHMGKQHLKRTYDETTGDDDLASRLFEMANQYGCHVLHDVVANRREGIAAQKEKGHELYGRAMATTNDWDTDTVASVDDDLFEDLDADPEAFGFDPSKVDRDGASAPDPDGGVEAPFQVEPPAEDRETMEAISAAVDARDEDEAEGD